jgi:hypothetical protein
VKNEKLKIKNWVMKKVLFIAIFLGISTGSIAQTNVYHPFPTQDAIWRGYLADNVFHNYKAYEYLISGDTIITGKTYHKLIKLIASYAINPSGNPILDSLGPAYQSYFGAFREDTALKKVYFMPTWNSNELLLYDFNLQLGDTLSGVNVDNHTYVATVDSILVGTKYRRRLGIANLYTFNFPYVYLIEGIGSTSDFYFAYNVPFEGYRVLYCYTQDGVHLYQSTDLHSTCDYLSVNEHDPIKYFSFSPNPFTQSTQISLNQTYHNIALAVYDIQGKQVAQQQYTDCDKIQLSRKQLSNGLYFLKLTLDDKEVETGKIIISE